MRLAEQLLVLLVAHAVVHLHVLTDEAFVGELHQALRRHLRQQVQAVIRQGTHRQQQGFYVLVRHERTHVHQVLDGLLFAGGGAFQRGLAGDDAAGLRGVGHHEQRLGGQLVLTNQRGGRFRNGHDRVAVIEQEALRGVGLVEEPPAHAHRCGQEPGRGRVRVVDQVVQGEDQLEFASGGADGLHGGEHHVRRVLIQLQRGGRFERAGGRADLHVRQIRQHVQLTLVANDHGQVEAGGGFVTGIDEGFERAQQGRGVAADAVVEADTGVSGVNHEFHVGSLLLVP